MQSKVEILNDRRVRSIRVSVKVSPTEGDSININALYKELVDKARIELHDAGFTPVDQVVCHLEDSDPITLERVLAIETAGVRDA